MSKVEGHFEITNKAFNELKKEIPACTLLSGVPTVKGRLGRGNVSHFIHGSANIAVTDTETPAWGAVYRDVRDVWNLGHWKDSAQKHHFMRKFSGQNSRAAYEEAVRWIKKEATNAALELHRNMISSKAGNLFAGRASDHLGNALHALQDSFSASHVKRVPETHTARDPEKLKAGPGMIAKVYLYEGHERKGHGDLDEQWTTDGDVFSMRGRHAVNATKQLIKMVVTMAGSGRATLDGWDAFQGRWLRTSPELDKHHELRNKNLLERYIYIYVTDCGRMTIIETQRLADAIFRDLSTDPVNLKEVIKAFDEAHWAESDDLAERYVRKVMDVGGAPLATLKSDQELVKLLIRCQDEGWTTGDEQECIDWLKTLL